METPRRPIEILFERMALVYGEAWTRSHGVTPMEDMQNFWDAELKGFVGRDVKYALDNLPDQPPNIIQFKKLCRSAPAPEVKFLDRPKADEAVVRKEIAKIAGLIRSEAPGKHWAQRILDKQAAGEPVTPTTLRMAKEALRREPSQE